MKMEPIITTDANELVRQIQEEKDALQKKNVENTIKMVQILLKSGFTKEEIISYAKLLSSDPEVQKIIKEYL